VRTRGNGGGACDDTKSEFEKFPAFHLSFLLQSRVMRNKFRRAEMNAC